MIDTDALRAEWVKNRMKQQDVAISIVGVTPKTFSLKLKKGILGSDEIERLIIGLHIEKPINIFFKTG